MAASAVRRTLAVWVTVASCLVVTILGAPGAARAHDTLPVSHDFFDGARAELRNPGGSLPGSNDWHCTPSAAHPNPVILVHGTGGNRQTNWATMVPALHNEGYCVFALTYGVRPGTTWPVSALGGLNDMRTSAVELQRFVARVRAATGARQVDIVGHSEGTLMPAYWVKYRGGAHEVDKYISLAPYWKGQDSSACNGAAAVLDSVGAGGLWPYPECNQEQYGSAFMNQINAGGGPYVPGIAYTNVMTRHDGIVEPYTDGDVPGPRTTNIVLQDTCPADRSDHLSIVASPRSVAVVLNALDPAHPRPVPCVPVAPGLGG
ncbi:esterase/lipase family protein [Gordonia sp. (in: high G+C Gram-positive bacteria)]|uniref:esterase/lipase family protein n=1 Tax=Gordonia sp. (in: high G+C Gram-positive bacteria) TaxID=84139 RepID=UPI003526FBC8